MHECRVSLRLWPRPKLSRPIQYSALETQKFGLFSNGHCMACGRLYKLESYLHAKMYDNCSAALGQSGLKSNIRASNLQNFPGGAYPNIPLACACLCMSSHKSLASPIMYSAVIVNYQMCCLDAGKAHQSSENPRFYLESLLI